ncbi:MAG: hypothetical protein PVF73_13380 [Bacteroidales bacterium]|jgi:hypothetical protein
MTENYNHGKLFGPSGITAGYILLIMGVITVYFTYTAIPVILTGVIMAFSYTGTRLDLQKKRYQTYFMLFGFIRVGLWLPFEKSDRLFVKEYKGKHTTYSRGNRRISTESHGFRVLLETTYNEKKKTMAGFDNEQDAQEKARQLQKMIDAIKI